LRCAHYTFSSSHLVLALRTARHGSSFESAATAHEPSSLSPSFLSTPLHSNYRNLSLLSRPDSSAPVPLIIIPTPISLQLHKRLRSPISSPFRNNPQAQRSNHLPLPYRKELSSEQRGSNKVRAEKHTPPGNGITYERVCARLTAAVVDLSFSFFRSVPYNHGRCIGS
jgi:hypothetical protein